MNPQQHKEASRDFKRWYSKHFRKELTGLSLMEQSEIRLKYLNEKGIYPDISSVSKRSGILYVSVIHDKNSDTIWNSIPEYHKKIEDANASAIEHAFERRDEQLK